MIIIFPKLGVRGMAIFPFIFIRSSADRNHGQLIRHELIHHRQQLELLIVPFYIFYVLEYFFHRMHGMKHYEAYMNISFEKEAYQHDHECDYLQKRALWAFTKYL